MIAAAGSPGRAVAAAAALLWSTGCAHDPAPNALADPVTTASELSSAPPPASEPIATPAPDPDPVAARVARADELVAWGEARLAEGDHDGARRAFDEAVAHLLAAPGGVPANPRLAEAWSRTVEAIHLRELSAAVAASELAGNPEAAAADLLASLALPPADQRVRRLAEEGVRERPGDFPLALNDAVVSSLQLYQGPLRAWFAEALVRSGRYVEDIREVFAGQGLPTDLAWAALVESAFKPHAVSRARARGIWQFMPATGRRFGLRQNAWLDERSDPFASTRAAARYLRELHGRFGDWNLALAAYNAGEHRVARALARTGAEDFWELRRRRALPRETRSHVPFIHAAILIARSPTLYGFDVRPEAPLRFATLTTSRPAHLVGLAKCAELPLEALQHLNPQLLSLSAPDGYALRVPPDRSAEVVACLDAAPAARAHVVQPGETLSEIAARYGTTVSQLQLWNGLSTSRIIAGHTIAIYR